ncbi:uncharacterized protein MONBRDRAFT_34069 [Monosiga brevicollis MX1]|uniref:SAM domain-containing protein n=1 Tax=Monosiga brevicollis TaxID=81824 RepID=A9V9A7_MONBE|nr:uncharacterized protein MONBRDRAFT_34069 [Monosiga brevicollis MX1]EDQ85897.1 predicted protein [Monosiga brevicollis MX1]|eukprot:XP_001749376.1 hypothetical protein [Monosiga brevicollis MX1]
MWWRGVLVMSCLVVGGVVAWSDCEARTWEAAQRILATRCNELELKRAAPVSADSETFISFVAALRANAGVRKLELNDIPFDEAMTEALIEALVDRPTDLYSLELTNLQLGDEGADIVASFLAKTSALRALNLGHNAIGDVGVTALAAALPTSLHELDLSWNAIAASGFEALIEALSSTTVRELELDHNAVTDEALQKALPILAPTHQPYLRELDLDENPLTATGVAQLQALVAQYSAQRRKLKVKWPRSLPSPSIRDGKAAHPATRAPFASSVRRKPAAASWTEDQVKSWVERIHPQFRLYAKGFLSHAIDGSVLLALTDQDLIDMGIDNSLHRKRILSEIAKLSNVDELR